MVVAAAVVLVVLGAAALTSVLPTEVQRLIFHGPVLIAVLIGGTAWLLWRISRGRPAWMSRQFAAWTCVGNEDGCHASTTSVPFLGAVTIVSDAPIRSARSCMLVMPKPDGEGSRAMPRPSSETDNRKPTDCAVEALMTIRRALECRTAFVRASCAMAAVSVISPTSTAAPLVG